MLLLSAAATMRRLLWIWIGIMSDATQNTHSIPVEMTYSVHAGQTVELRCSATQKSVVLPVEWKIQHTPEHDAVYIFIGESGKNPDFDEQFERSGTSMIIRDVTENDTAYYHCSEEGGIGDSHAMYLNVTIARPSTVSSTLSISQPGSESMSSPTGVYIAVGSLFPGLLTAGGIAFFAFLLYKKVYHADGRQSYDRIPDGDFEEAMPRDDAILGLSILDDWLFVLRCRNTQQIDVYNTEQRTTGDEYKKCGTIFKIPGLEAKAMADMAACSTKHCLYLSDDFNKSIHRVDLSHVTTDTDFWQLDPVRHVTEWQVDVERPRGLSVTNEAQVLVTCRQNQELRLYESEGKLVRIIGLQGLRMSNPWHAIQLPQRTGGPRHKIRFMVSHGFRISSHRICVVEENIDTGRVHIVRSFEQMPGNDPFGRLNWPSHLAVDSCGRAYVADHNNYRVLLLNPELDSASHVAETKNMPRRLGLDEDKRRLYVADCLATSGQVITINLPPLAATPDATLYEVPGIPMPEV